MAQTLRPPPPGASPCGLYECLCALAEEARGIGLSESARAILLAAEFVAVEAEENGSTVAAQQRPARDIRYG